MKLVIISMVYGAAMPLFFTITLIAFILSYFIDKYTVAFYY